ISSQSLHVVYDGSALKPFTKYYWRLKVYGVNDEPTPWTSTASFETAILSTSEWKAKWIGDGSVQFEKDEDFYHDDPMPLFKKAFHMNKKIISARLYVSGLGYYEAYLNGKKVGDRMLEPGFTSYRKQALYSTYDITGQLKKGKNIIGLMLGNGWYNPLPLRLFGRFNLRDVQQTGRPCLKAQLLIRFADGTEQIVISDDSWLTAPGPIVRNNVYLGERYDARLEKKSWFTDVPGGWKNASVVEGPSGSLTSQLVPPIRVTAVLKPLRVYAAGKDTFIADMGQNFAGVARIRIQAPAGTKVNLRYGEDTLTQGRLNFYTTVAGQIKEVFRLNGGPGAPKTAWQEDQYITNGIGVETWSPRFTFHGFRYVEITGWPGTPTIADIEGLRMNSDLPAVGEFACSNEMFNHLNKTIQWTFLSNVFSVQSDCPGREKMGYGGDMVATAQAYIYNYDMANFYRKAVNDFVNDQQPDGGITEIAPHTGIADRGYGGASGPLGWQLAFPFLQKQLYDFYGDKRIIEKNYEAFKKQMDFLESKAINGLFHWDISDHEALDPRPEAFTAAAFYFHHAILATEFASILGMKQDSIKYAKLSQSIRNAIVRKYLIPGTGRFDNATQSAQLFALWYGLSPEKEKSFQVLLEEFSRHKNHVSTGIFSTQMLFNVLRIHDRNDVAYTIVNQRDYPGWGFMLAHGATTLWETWKYPDNAPSQNHPMFGSVSEWFYRSLLGINASSAGFETILIKPQPAGDLGWARGSYNSIRGPITSDWKISNSQFALTVSIPANTTAEVWIRCKENGRILENGKTLDPSLS
ncbi:MAG TPA: family 78 glycoside hydrolase catalytic domain, partial [Flavitalea sp.]|nr:family 78 glycoside hydrolase catalytic domain [Flavitalea sp.]